METKFTLDLVQFGAGALFGLFVGLLLRLRSLKSLDLKLNQIGLDLGIQGFQTPSGEGSILNTNKGNIGGDFVGRDKTTTNQSFYDKLQKYVSASGRSNGQATARATLMVHTRDTEFSKTLRDIQRSNDDWSYKYFDACLKRTEFLDPMRAKIAELKANGWETRELSFDNHSSNDMNGLHVSFHVARTLASET